MAGIKRKEAPKAVSTSTFDSKKQKLGGVGASKKRAAPVKQASPESEPSDNDDDDDDELDGDEDAMSGVDENRNSESEGDKKIRSG